MDTVRDLDTSPRQLVQLQRISRRHGPLQHEKSATFHLPIFGQLGLNNQGRKNARKGRKHEKRTKGRKNRKKGVPHRHLSRTYIMISVSHSCERMPVRREWPKPKCRVKGMAKGDLLWKRDPASRGRAAPSPDSAVAGHTGITFVCALGKLCVHALGGPSCSAAVCGSRGAGAAQIPPNISGVEPQTSLSPGRVVQFRATSRERVVQSRGPELLRGKLQWNHQNGSGPSNSTPQILMEY